MLAIRADFDIRTLRRARAEPAAPWTQADQSSTVPITAKGSARAGASPALTCGHDCAAVAQAWLEVVRIDRCKERWHVRSTAPVETSVELVPVSPARSS